MTPENTDEEDVVYNIWEAYITQLKSGNVIPTEDQLMGQLETEAQRELLRKLLSPSKRTAALLLATKEKV